MSRRTRWHCCYPNSSAPQELTAFNGQLYFVATNEANGTELWKSDGTKAGTTLVKDINTGTYPGPMPLSGAARTSSHLM